MPDDDPSCYLIGDSISIQYGPHLAAALLDRCRYHRKAGEDEARLDLDQPRGANGGDSGMVRAFLAARAADPDTPRHDLLLVNCGLHDIKIAKDSGAIAVDAASYRENLEAIVALAPRLADRLVWIRTTPVDDERHAGRTGFGFHRYQRDVATYNGIADAVMQAAGVTILDLHGFTLSCGEELFSDGVHFTAAVQQRQGAWLAGWILGLLH